MKRAGLVSSSLALQARESKQIKRNETIKKRWIAVFPSTHGLLKKKREREKRCHPQRGRGKQQIPFPGLLPTKAKVANDPGTLPLTFSSGRVFMPG